VFPKGHPQPGLLVRNLPFASLRGLLASSHSNERISQEEFSEEIDASMFNTVTGKKIAGLGYAFKKDTGDVRETPSMFVVRDLLQENAIIHIYDPQVTLEKTMAIGMMKKH
jgi:UDP-glucose 6-dehydrogenase